MEWGENFPDHCPPHDSVSGSFKVYRFLEGNSIHSSDFLTVRDKVPSRKFPEIEKECRACSLSVFTDRSEVLSLQRRVPRWRKAVAIGQLNVTSGKLKPTPSPQTNNFHHSWWVSKDVSAVDLFWNVMEAPSEV